MRICFYQEGSHKAYLLWLHKLISEFGYCNVNKPKITSRLGLDGKLRSIIRFKTFTYSNLNWVYDLFKGVKAIPLNIETYLTPLALAIWIMDDGGKSSMGLKLSTQCFTKEEVLLLSNSINNKFKFHSTLHSTGKKDQYFIYIPKQDMPLLNKIIANYIHPSMKYKVIINNN